MTPDTPQRDGAMIQIVDNTVDLELPLGHGVHTLIAQIPDRLRLEGGLFKIRDPEAQTQVVRSILSLAASQDETERVHFIILPESSVPFRLLREVASTLRESLPANTIVVFGLEHITLAEYRDLLAEHQSDNAAALEMVLSERGTNDRSKPVNVCATLVKERNGRVRSFFSAKTHPFAGEESVDSVFDLYRGRHFHLFSCTGTPYNFLPLICFDYVYRDLYQSNIMAIIEKANWLFFSRRQRLDLLLVIQCNPKPEHEVFRDVATGFYGEHLFKTPGTRDTVTVFVNTSRETELEGMVRGDGFGHSSVVCGTRHRLPRIKLSEFRSDDFSGSPLTRLRFGPSTRLYLCRLFPHHETDPRSSRTMVKMTGVYRLAEDGSWLRFSGEELVAGVAEDGDNPMHIY